MAIAGRELISPSKAIEIRNALPRQIEGLGISVALYTSGVRVPLGGGNGTMFEPIFQL